MSPYKSPTSLRLQSCVSKHRCIVGHMTVDVSLRFMMRRTVWVVFAAMSVLPVEAFSAPQATAPGKVSIVWKDGGAAP